MNHERLSYIILWVSVTLQIGGIALVFLGGDCVANGPVLTTASKVGGVLGILGIISGLLWATWPGAYPWEQSSNHQVSREKR